MDLSVSLQLAQGRAVAPSDVEITRSRGRGSLIDHAIVSAELGGVVSVSSYNTGPFKTHARLATRLVQETLHQQMRKR
eukprot:7784372-Pyramimonas_sp.AAC.1